MPTLPERFQTLSASEQKAVQEGLCHDALQVWKSYCGKMDDLSYVETVCGSLQEVDRTLPEAAFRAAVAGADVEDVADRYGEPISAMQDDDLEFPDDVEFAYYAIYNLFNRHVTGRSIDDWLIVNQALSAHGEGADFAAILESTIAGIGE